MKLRLKPKESQRTLVVGVVNDGNGIGNFDSAKQAVENKIDCKLEVFQESDWKKALQWLIDNAE